MKRHHKQTAQQILTLSLMGSLALLAACGGGKGGDPAPAAPAATVEPEPSLAQASDPNEPYLVGESYSVTRDVQTYQLDIVDGIRQKRLVKLPFLTSMKGKWITVNKIERTPVPGSSTEVKEVDKGPTTLYYIEPNSYTETKDVTVDGKTEKVTSTHIGGKLFQMDLTRSTVADYVPTAKNISSITDACLITSSYNLVQDGTKSALLVSTAGSDKECGDVNGTATQKKLAEDNVMYVVATDDPTTVAHKVLQPKSKVLSYLYEPVGDQSKLTGVLVQHPNADGTAAQLDVLSPTQDTLLTDAGGITISSDSVSSFKTFSLDPTKPDDVGAHWITRAPGTYSDGYFRIRGSAVIDGETTPFNTMYKLTWSGTTKVAQAIYVYDLVDLYPNSNPGVTDDKYIYFVDNNQLFYGPFKPSDPFPPLTGEPPFLKSNEPVTKLYQTASSVIAEQRKAGGYTEVRAANKKTGYVATIAGGYDDQKFQILGIQNDFIYVSAMRVDDSYGVHIFANASVVESETDQRPKANDVVSQDSVMVVGKLTDPDLVYGTKPVSRIITCTPLSGRSTCLSGTFKVVDLASKKFTKELGVLNVRNAAKVTIDAPDGLVGTNSLITVQGVSSNGLIRKASSWIFNSGVAKSLFQIEEPEEADAAK